MKLKTVLLISVILFMYSCKNDNKKPFLKNEIKGNVKFITETSYKAVEKFGKIQNGHKMNIQAFNYSDIGKLTEYNDYQLDGSLAYKSTYKYNDEGGLNESSSYKSTGKLISKSTAKYDNKQGYVEEFFYNKEGDIDFMLRFKHNINGELAELLTYESDGDLEYKILYEYDDQGNLTQENHFNSNGNLIVSKEFNYIEFDSEKNWLNREMYVNKTPKQVSERVVEYY